MSTTGRRAAASPIPRVERASNFSARRRVTGGGERGGRSRRVRKRGSRGRGHAEMIVVAHGVEEEEGKQRERRREGRQREGLTRWVLRSHTTGIRCAHRRGLLMAGPYVRVLYARSGSTCPWLLPSALARRRRRRRRSISAGPPRPLFLVAYPTVATVGRPFLRFVPRPYV